MRTTRLSIDGELAELIDGYRERFVWYRDYMQASSPAGARTLVDLPLIDQEALLNNYYQAPALPHASIFFTSGTSGGEKKRVQYSDSDDRHYVEQRSQVFARFLEDITPGALAVADLGTGHAAANARKSFEQIGLEARDIEFSKPIDEHIQILNEWNPDVLFTMPMMMDQLVNSQNRLTARPKKIIVVGDLATESWRQNVAEHFAIPIQNILDVVGSIEVGAIAFLEPETGRYRFHDHIIPEVIPPQGNAGYTNTPNHGELVLTSLTREYFPAIRYRTGDLIEGLKVESRNGVWEVTFERLLGRINGDFKHGERVSSYDVSEAVAKIFPHAPFEVSDDRGVLDIRIVVPEVSARQSEELRRLIAKSSPGVATMMQNGLVGEVAVSAITLAELRSGKNKRRFNLKEQ